jgi:peptide/nickel transport system substrate-binding protein
MNSLSRREFLGGTVATAAAVTLGAPSVHAQKGQRSLRFVAHGDLKILDPVWTTGYITRNHGYLIYDTLFGTDEKLEVKPQMVDRSSVSQDGMKYVFTLRDGLKWHDGEPVVAEDCVESLKRWGKKDRFGRLLMAHTARIVAVDKKTFALELGEWFGPVIDALGKPSLRVPFMMPAPGGKKTFLDKVLWRYIPDHETAASALAASEVDWWEQPPPDFIPKIEQNPTLRTAPFDPLGSQGVLRPNHLHPPFNNKKARQALLHMMDQITYLHWAIGQAKYYQPCHSIYACRGPYATHAGAEPIMKPDPRPGEAAREGVGLRWPADRDPPRH